MGKESPRITTQTLSILSVFLASPAEEIAGSDIARKTGLKSGTLYPALFRLEQAGWLQSKWEGGVPAELGRPRRRIYLLTPKGEEQARSVCVKVSEMIGGIAWQST
jgi:PadR family transcriptional regulator, regulatory protein PadR